MADPIVNAKQALAEAVAYLQGVGNDIDPDRGAELIAEQLARRGFSIQPISAPVLHDVNPDSLRRVRKALGVTMERLANESGVNIVTIGRTESGRTRPQGATAQMIVNALVRLGAKRPE